MKMNINIFRRKHKDTQRVQDLEVQQGEEGVNTEEKMSMNLIQRAIALVPCSPSFAMTVVPMLLVFIIFCSYSLLVLSPQKRFLKTAQVQPSHKEVIIFNNQYPECRATDMTSLGDGKCNPENNVPECNFDGGDCCPVAGSPFLGDGYCDGLVFNTEVCGFDAGDCLHLNKKYPNCDVTKDFTLLELYIKNQEIEASPIIRKSIGDGVCENFKLYNVPECGFEDGDCEDCMHKFKGHFDKTDGLFDTFGDAECHQVSPLNIDICGYDGGDCATVI
mmetsp:Transcript_3795/g.4652  ORF Transcript_3795/g.4652 Transcript_3795/m.4652 type:complete len:275 (+) Transcript_3795:119-943(+)